MSISARVIYQLGEQLIKDEFVALTELIKNSYDADATGIRITIDTRVKTQYGQGRITIEDNGNGMTRSILFDSFLRISTNFKVIEKFSPVFERRTLGEKGLGRLAMQRLGEYVIVSTKPKVNEPKLMKIFSTSDIEFHKVYDTTELHINWASFKNSNENFDDMNIEYKHVSKLELKYGTKLVIEGIRNVSFWRIGRKELNRFRKELFGLVNPFTQNSDLKFNILLDIDGSRISNERIDENLLKIMSDISVDFSVKDWILTLNIDSKPNYVERLCAGLIYRMSSLGFDKYTRFEGRNSRYSNYIDNIIINLNDKQFTNNYPYLKDVRLMETKKIKDKPLKITVSNLKVHSLSKNVYKIKYNYEKWIRIISDSLQRKTELAYPGNFYGKLYVMAGDPDSIREAIYKLNNNGIVFNTQAEIKSIWDSASGVKLFRDHFRIFPYGELTEEGINDWLNFTYKSQRGRATAYKSHTVAGYVNLDGVSSENIQEQTNRNGIIENEFGKNFLSIVRDIIAEIVFQRDLALRGWFATPEIKEDMTEVKSKDGHLVFSRELTKPHNEEELQSLDKTVNELVNNANVDDATKKKVEFVKNKVNDIIKKEINRERARKQAITIREQRISYLENLIGLAGQGMIVESLTHELERIEKNISHYAKESKIDLFKIENIKGQFGYIIEKQEGILQQVVFLQQQLEHLEPNYKKNQFKKDIVNIKEFLCDLYINKGPMANKAKNKDAEITVDSDVEGNLELNTNKGVLITIFDNIFINSLYWLENSKNKKIVFFVDSRNRTVTIYDSGPGIHRDREFDLFEPEKSSKPNGRGLGLYIVKELMSYLRGNIYLDTINRNSFGNLFKFVLQFPENNV